MSNNSQKENIWIEKLKIQIKHNINYIQNNKQNLDIKQKSFDNLIQCIKNEQTKNITKETISYTLMKFTKLIKAIFTLANIPKLSLYTLTTVSMIFLCINLYIYNKLQTLKIINNSYQMQSELFTLSGDENVVAIQKNRLLLKVTFNPYSQEQDIRKLLQSINANIINGPSAIGVYTISLEIDKANTAGKVDKNAQDELIQKLKINNKLINNIQIIEQ